MSGPWGRAVKLNVPKGSQVVDLKGKTAMPGLVDTHAHYRDWQGEIYLAQGVTTAFDIGSNPLSWSFAQKEGIDKGKIVGPCLLLGGRINGPSAPTGSRARRSRNWASILGAMSSWLRPV